MHPFLIFIISWFLVGFLSGFKQIFFDGRLKEVIKNAEKDDNIPDEMKEYMIKFYNSKLACLLTLTFLGYITFISDTIRTFKKEEQKAE